MIDIIGEERSQIGTPLGAATIANFLFSIMGYSKILLLLEYSGIQGVFLTGIEINFGSHLSGLRPPLPLPNRSRGKTFFLNIMEGI